ncbi:competence/damage-inducible protein A [Archaeoglobus veneficus]|uniref:Molybdopterin binding domain protein n=1 Tax=Archaeoglobus veneficus (strain DSM 11195 / SNP6) TaxID=693661 RepID=F2KSH3_ARCVS|nr:molybdopterin-binding protein [Archaeoglobus veneficus]AEA46942.1 molybdopterin binding domain protein [Archaeoglobus veneficus SNP6]
MDFIIISVGNELLCGDTQNTNATYMAKRLTHSGHRVKRIIVVPDDVEEIAMEISRARDMADFVLVTGGLGVTHDDVTAEGVAKALGRKLVLNKDAVESMKGRVGNEGAIRKMATLPEGSEVIKNDVGAAPGFIVENVAVMPGVPREMENIFEKLISRFGVSDYHEEQVKVEGFEDRIADKLQIVVSEYPDVSVGSYPKPGYIVVKFSGKDRKRVISAKQRFMELAGLV